MSKKSKMAAVAGLAVLLVAVVVGGQALAQSGTLTPSGMMGPGGGMMMGTPMPGGMMAGTPMPGGMMAGTSMPGGLMMGTPMPGMRDGTPGPGADAMPGMMGQGQAASGMMPGMMSSDMMGMMMQMMGHGAGMGGNMMGMDGGWSDPNAPPLTLDQARAAAQSFIESHHGADAASLTPFRVMEFTNHFYVAVADRTTNTGAFSLLVGRYDGNVTHEPGPNMAWNTEYGDMNGEGGAEMGRRGLWNPPDMLPSVSSAQARTNAEAFLAVKFPGATLAPQVIVYPGFYGLDFMYNGQPAGMLSVNAFSGQVWYHTWHGQFLSQRMTG